MSCPELILLPGLDGTGRLFAPLVKALAQCGVSARAIGYPTHDALDYVELERRVRAELPECSAFVLLAESFSGPIALRIGAAPPANLKGLVLSTTFATRPTSLLGPLSGGVRWARLRPPGFLLDWFLLGRSAHRFASRSAWRWGEELHASGAKLGLSLGALREGRCAARAPYDDA